MDDRAISGLRIETLLNLAGANYDGLRTPDRALKN